MKVGLLVNDWIFEHGGSDVSELYNAVQGLGAEGNKKFGAGGGT
mgnify:CR=1 FL=1